MINSMMTPRVATLEKYETKPALPKSHSSPKLHDAGIDAPKLPCIVKARASRSFTCPQLPKSEKSHQRGRCELQFGGCSSALSSSSDKDIFDLSSQRLAYAAMTPMEILNLKNDCLTLNFYVLSSYPRRPGASVQRRCALTAPAFRTQRRRAVRLQSARRADRTRRAPRVGTRGWRTC